MIETFRFVTTVMWFLILWMPVRCCQSKLCKACQMKNKSLDETIKKIPLMPTFEFVGSSCVVLHVKIVGQDQLKTNTQFTQPEIDLEGSPFD